MQKPRLFFQEDMSLKSFSQHDVHLVILTYFYTILLITGFGHIENAF